MDNFEPDDTLDGPVPNSAIPTGDRGGVGHETDGPESDATAAHSSRGFKRALLKAGSSGLLPDKIKAMGKTPHKRQGFAQGGGRHGLHLGNAGGMDTGHAKMFGKKGGNKKF